MEKRSYNVWMGLAAVLMAITFCVHAFVGGPEIYSPLRVAPLSPELIAVLSVVWHMVTVQLLIGAVSLFYLTKTKNNAVFMLSLASFIGTSMLFIGYSLADLGSIWLLPQWIAFLGTSVLMLLGARNP